MNEALPLPLRRWFWLQVLVLIGAALCWLPALANDLGDRADRYDRDPPTRVARVAELQGQASWYDAEQRSWQPLLRNQTLAEGDRIRVENNGRVGLRIGPHGLWLDERSELEIRRLDDTRIDLDLEQGALALRWLTREAASDALVRTREGRFVFERAGAYRIDQLNRASRAQAFEGRLRFDHRGADDAPVMLEASEQVELWWENGPRTERSRLLRMDSFGDWITASLGFGRGEQLAWRERPAYRYVSPELNGAEELDSHGRWETSAEFGPIWTPLRVSVDWAPFRSGRWLWTRHWGWTWVDEQPWGYATSHYGRWVHWRGRWCWTPGAVVVPRPVFAPALVAWVGHGNVQVGVQIGGGRYAPPVAWVPLAPYETYRPWYRHSPGYLRRVDPDPQTVRRPVEGWAGHNRAVPGALSTVQLEAGPERRAMPVRVDGPSQPWTPLAQAPTRQWAVREPLRDAQREPGREGFGPSLPLRTHAETEPGPRVRAGGSQGLPSVPTAPAAQAPAVPVPMGPPQVVQPPVAVEPRREPDWRNERNERIQRERERELEEPRRQPQPAWRGERNEPRGDERPPAWRVPRPEVAPMPAPQRVEPPQRMEPPPRVEVPMRRIEVPRAEPPRAAEPPPQRRQHRDDDGGPRRNPQQQLQ